MNRRGFLGAILATATAPAIVSSGVLMPVRKIWTPAEPFFFAIDEGLRWNAVDGRYVPFDVTVTIDARLPARALYQGLSFYSMERARLVSEEISDTLAQVLRGDRRSFELQADRCATTARDLDLSSVRVPRR
jgi:hypothetical protein